MAFFSCTVNEIGPAANGAETPHPVIYINLTDTGGSFTNQWFHAAENSKCQMLSVGLAAMSTRQTGRSGHRHAERSRIRASSRHVSMGPAGGGTKLAFNQSLIGMPTSGKTLDPIDISAFAKIRFSVTVNGSGSIQFLLLSGTGGPVPCRIRPR